MKTSEPFISVVIPVYNGGEDIGRCLDALNGSAYPSFEIILVDDSSTDDTVEIAGKKGVRIVELTRRSGPALARNIGVEHAKGEIILFIDSDVEVRGDTIERVALSFKDNPEIAAVFGSYDDEPADKRFISQYRNLLHHFHHQQLDSEAFSFWTGCGGVRKEVFTKLGGFDHARYKKPSIEDIEFGLRAIKRGYRIVLDKELQVKHLKGWKFNHMVLSDILQRAVPWSALIIETGYMPKGLNLKFSEKISSICVALMVLALPLLSLSGARVYGYEASILAVLFFISLFMAVVVLNRRLYTFFFRSRGPWFLLATIPIHFLYYIYCGLSFVFTWVTLKVSFLNPIYYLVLRRNAL